MRLVGACCLVTFLIYHHKNIQNVLFYGEDQSIVDRITENKGIFTIDGVDESLLNCSDIKIYENIGEGWQKKVFRAGDECAVKVPRVDGPTYIDCLKTNEKRLLQIMVDEIWWHYKLLNNPCVVKLKSYCVSMDISQVRIVVERGEPLTSLFMVQLSWKARKQIIYDILKILNSLRAFTMNDFRRQQIVMVKGKPRLADLDHLIDSPQNSSVIFNKLKFEFLPFLETSDAPGWFLHGIKHVSSVESLEQLLNRKRYESGLETCN